MDETEKSQELRTTQRDAVARWRAALVAGDHAEVTRLVDESRASRRVEEEPEP